MIQRLAATDSSLIGKELQEQATDHVSYGILDVIGNTPLVQLNRYLDESEVRLFGKLESANPGGSAKDRPAVQMLTHAIRSDKVRPTTTIIESSSGNMGIGLAQACRYLGHKFICVTDPYAQPQNIAIMQALGATIERVTEPCEGSYLAARLARVAQLLESIPDSYWPDQYANQKNPASHYLGTIREIDDALEGKLDFLFVAASSTGTAQGCRDYLSEKNRATQVIVVDAVGSVLFGGSPGTRQIPGLGAGQVPPLAREQSFDAVRRVTDVSCVIGCRRAAFREALLLGGSGGGVLEVIRAKQEELAGKTCVAILHDSGTRYLDTIYNDQWVKNALGKSAEQIRNAVSAPPLAPELASLP